MRNHTCVLALCITGLVCIPRGAAARQAVSFDQLPRVMSPGDTVRVTLIKGQTTEGKLVRIDDSLLDLRLPGGTYQARKDDILEIRLLPPDGVGDGALIGAVAGFGIGALASCADGNQGIVDFCSGAGLGMVGGLFAGVGALIGFAVDASHVKSVTVYRAPAGRPVTVRFAPVGSYGRAGLRVSISF